MILDRIFIEAFRGITNQIDINLTALLTVIYAPNGTGKTSICDAVEWLLTGEVARFREALGKTKGKGIQSIFTPECPIVECNLRFNGQNLLVRRDNNIKPARILVSDGSGLEEKPLNQLLKMITPQTLPPTAKGLQRINSRRSWLRAVRFLEAHALDLLLDSDDEGDEVRDLVFCELLGVGELQRQERDLGKILKAFTSKTSLNRQFHATHLKIENIKIEVQTHISNISVPRKEAIKKQLSIVAQRIGLAQFSESETFELSLSELLNAIRLKEDKHSKKREIFNYLSNNSTLKEKLDKEFSLLAKQQQDLNAQREIHQKNLDGVKLSIQGNETSIAKIETLISAIEVEQIDALNKGLRTTVQQWNDISGDRNIVADYDGIESDLSKISKQLEIARKKLDVVLKCEANLPLWREAQSRKAKAEKKLSTIKLPDDEERNKADQELSGAKVETSQIDAKYTRLTGPLDQLRSSGQRFIEDAVNEQVCPLCHHDYGSPHALHSAINKGIEALPVVIEDLTKKKQTLEEQIAILKQRFIEWDNARQEITFANEEIESTRQTLEDAAKTLSIIEIGSDQLDRVDLNAELTRLRSDLEGAITSSISQHSKKEKQVQIARELFKFALSLTSIIDQLREVVSIPKLTVNHVKQPPFQWLAEFEKVSQNIKKEKDRVQAEISKSRKSLIKKQEELVIYNQSTDRIHKSIEENAKKIGVVETKRNEFEAQWHLLADDLPWSVENLKQQSIQIDNLADEITKSKIAFQSAKNMLDDTREAENLELERNSRLKHIEELNLQLSEIKSEIKLREQCEEGLTYIRSAKDAFVAQQIKPLCDVISALYVRAQSNAFINRIDSSVGNGPLRWLARIGERSLQDTIQMSLGQRQDLALSIFLARARELGGTFFLDEPLLHLDDLNRIALLDVLRTIVVEKRSRPMQLVVTTANNSLVRHIKEKFALVGERGDHPPLRLYRLKGGPQTGIDISEY